MSETHKLFGKNGKLHPDVASLELEGKEPMTADQSKEILGILKRAGLDVSLDDISGATSDAAEETVTNLRNLAKILKI